MFSRPGATTSSVPKRGIIASASPCPAGRSYSTIDVAGAVDGVGHACTTRRPPGRSACTVDARRRCRRRAPPARPVTCHCGAGVAPQRDVRAAGPSAPRRACDFQRADVVVGRRAPEVGPRAALDQRRALVAVGGDHAGRACRSAARSPRPCRPAQSASFFMLERGALRRDIRRRGRADRQRELLPGDLVALRRPRRVRLQREAQVQPVLGAGLRARASAAAA